MQTPKAKLSPKLVAKTLKIFLTLTLPIAEQAIYKHEEIAVAIAEMLEAHKTPTEAAREYGMHHTTLTRRLAKAAPEAMPKALKKALKPYVRGSRLCAVDFTFLPTHVKSLAGYVRRGGLKMLVAYMPGQLAAAAGPQAPGEAPDEVLEKLLDELPRGSVLVADAEFSSAACLEKMLGKLDKGELAGFLVRANKQWHRKLWERLEREPYGVPVPVKLMGHDLYAWRVMLKTREGPRSAMLLSTSPKLGPELYRRRWNVEVFFRIVKELMPPCRLRSLEGRLLLFWAALLLALLAVLLGGLPAVRRCLRGLLGRSAGAAALRLAAAAWPA